MNLLLQILMGIILVKIVYNVIVPKRLRIIFTKSFNIMFRLVEQQVDVLERNMVSTKGKNSKSNVIPINRARQNKKISQ